MALCRSHFHCRFQVQAFSCRRAVNSSVSFFDFTFPVLFLEIRHSLPDRVVDLVTKCSKVLDFRGWWLLVILLPSIHGPFPCALAQISAEHEFLSKLCPSEIGPGASRNVPAARNERVSTVVIDCEMVKTGRRKKDGILSEGLVVMNVNSGITCVRR
jgi:hypothetical protein